MDIHGFGDAVVQRIAATRLGARFVDEKAFEKDVLVESAWELSRVNPEDRVFTDNSTFTSTCSRRHSASYGYV